MTNKNDKKDKNELDKLAESLNRERQKKNRLELDLNFQREQCRKLDVRRKIQLGGLVVKAGLAEESPTLLLGLLLEAKTKLEEKVEGIEEKDKNEYRKKWQQLGDEAFLAEGEETKKTKD